MQTLGWLSPIEKRNILLDISTDKKVSHHLQMYIINEFVKNGVYKNI